MEEADPGKCSQGEDIKKYAGSIAFLCSFSLNAAQEAGHWNCVHFINRYFATHVQNFPCVPVETLTLPRSLFNVYRVTSVWYVWGRAFAVQDLWSTSVLVHQVSSGWLQVWHVSPLVWSLCKPLSHEKQLVQPQVWVTKKEDVKLLLKILFLVTRCKNFLSPTAFCFPSPHSYEDYLRTLWLGSKSRVWPWWTVRWGLSACAPEECGQGQGLFS